MASSVSEKHEKLKIRKAAEELLNQQIDRNMSVSFGDEGRCSFCPTIFGRRKRIPIPTGESKPKSRSQLFGVGKRIDPHQKLTEAASSLEERVKELEQRVLEGRTDAAAAMKTGNKSLALRLLKKSKLVETKMVANQKSLDAIEAQLLLLGEAAMQKTLASALASSSKGFKNQSKMIAKAENAIDVAADARDMAAELSDVFAEFGNSDTGAPDDLDLLAELNAMVAEDPSPATGETATQAMEKLEAKHSEWDEIELVRRNEKKKPSIRRRRADDRVQLLEPAMAV